MWQLKVNEPIQLSLTNFDIFMVLKMNKQATDWEIIFSKHMSDKRFAPRICKDYFYLNNNNRNNSKNWQNIWIDTSPKKINNGKKKNIPKGAQHH